MCDLTLIPSLFGGGWAVPNTLEATEELTRFFGDAPCEQPAIGGDVGWVVEPCQDEELAEAIRDAGLTVGR